MSYGNNPRNPFESGYRTGVRFVRTRAEMGADTAGLPTVEYAMLASYVQPRGTDAEFREALGRLCGESVENLRSWVSKGDQNDVTGFEALEALRLIGSLKQVTGNGGERYTMIGGRKIGGKAVAVKLLRMALRKEKFEGWDCGIKSFIECLPPPEVLDAGAWLPD